MTRAELIKKAAMAIYDCDASGVIYLSVAKVVAEAVLDALVPPGEAWLAPWENTLAMDTAVGNLPERRSSDLQDIYAAMRDAFLSEQDKGSGND